MLAVMPRFENCVWCGRPIAGKGRIDRIYCSDSHRVQACRARKGERWQGLRKPGDVPPPGEFIPRSALPLVAVRMKAQLDAALARVTELEAQLEARNKSEAVSIDATVALATAAQQQQKIDELTAEVAELRVDLQAEQDLSIKEEFAHEERIQALEQELEDTRTERAGAYEFFDEWQDKLFQAQGELLAEKNRAYAHEVELRRVRDELLLAQKQLQERGRELKKTESLLVLECERTTTLQDKLVQAGEEMKAVSKLAEEQRKNAERAKELLANQNASLRARLQKKQIAYGELKKTTAVFRRELALLRVEAARECSAHIDAKFQISVLEEELIVAQQQLAGTRVTLEETREQSQVEMDEQQHASATVERTLRVQLARMRKRAEYAERTLVEHLSSLAQRQRAIPRARPEDVKASAAPVKKGRRKAATRKKAVTPPHRGKRQAEKSGLLQRVKDLAGSIAIGTAIGAAGYSISTRGAKKPPVLGKETAKQPPSVDTERREPVRRHLRSVA